VGGPKVAGKSPWKIDEKAGIPGLGNVDKKLLKMAIEIDEFTHEQIVIFHS